MFEMDEAERARTLDIARRLKGVRWPALATAVLGAAVGVETEGAWVLLPLLAAMGGFILAGWALARVARPELVLIAALVFFQAAIVGLIAGSSVRPLDALGLLVLPLVAASMIFPSRLMLAAVAESVAVMVGAAYLVDPQRVHEMPPVLLLPLGVLLCVAVPGTAVRKLDLSARNTAVADPLTGALNRAAFEARVEELDALAASASATTIVGVMMADLDHFKGINDDLGHEAGDDVLREAVARIRNVLGIFTPVHRVGGEEFAIVVRGASEERVRQVAERVREAICVQPIRGRTVTLSIGAVTGSIRDHTMSELVEAADRALYRAKAEGRNRVVMADHPAAAAAAAAAEAARPRAEPGATAGAGTGVTASHQPAPERLAHDRGNWLVRGEFERDHMRALAQALSDTHHAAFGFIFLALIASIPWIGWTLFLPAAVAVAVYHAAERRVAQAKHPEYILGGSWLLVQLTIFWGSFIIGSFESCLLILLVPMMIGSNAVFPSRGTTVNVGVTVILIALAGLLNDAQIVHQPGILIAPLAVAIGIGLIGSISGRSAIEHRAKGAVDPLTGLLNRAALTARLAELDHESSVDTTSMAVITLDIDGFKTLNDTRGHAVGDALLRVVGTAMRENLRAFEWAFRVGGDEFVIVVPGRARGAAELAERLRSIVEALRVDDVSVTGSFGVAASPDGQAFDYSAVLRRADAAMYQAKREGRNRVVVASTDEADLYAGATALSIA